MRPMIWQIVIDDVGVTAIEYGLIAALVAVVCIAAGNCSAPISAPLSATWPEAFENERNLIGRCSVA